MQRTICLMLALTIAGCGQEPQIRTASGNFAGVALDVTWMDRSNGIATLRAARPGQGALPVRSLNTLAFHRFFEGATGCRVDPLRRIALQQSRIGPVAIRVPQICIDT